MKLRYKITLVTWLLSIFICLTVLSFYWFFLNLNTNSSGLAFSSCVISVSVTLNLVRLLATFFLQGNPVKIVTSIQINGTTVVKEMDAYQEKNN